VARRDDTERTWTERKPYPEAPREKYGASTGRPSAPEAVASVVEAWHVATPTDAELRERRAARPVPSATSAWGNPRARRRDTLPYGAPPQPRYASRENVLRGGGRGPAPPTEEVLAPAPPEPEAAPDSQRATPPGGRESDRPSHAPEGPGRATFPSLDGLDRLSVP
jgi:hypothetical protein